DRARVEQDQVRLGALGRLAVAERLEHPLHPLRVVLVHLAAEGGDVVAGHRPIGYPPINHAPFGARTLSPAAVTQPRARPSSPARAQSPAVWLLHSPGLPPLSLPPCLQPPPAAPTGPRGRCRARRRSLRGSPWRFRGARPDTSSRCR